MKISMYGVCKSWVEKGDALISTGAHHLPLIACHGFLLDVAEGKEAGMCDAYLSLSH